MSRRIVLLSPHDPVAAARLLKAAVAAELRPDSPRQVTGNGTEDTMTLWVHRPRVRNDFKTVLTATANAVAGGTRIEGRIGAPRAVGLFMGCWFAFVALFGVGGLAVLLGFGGSADTLPFALIPLGMLGFGVLLMVAGRWTGKRDEREILAFLETTIGARPA